MMATFGAIVLRDLRLALRAGGGAGLGVVFFLSVITLIPFAAGPDLPLLARIGPAMLWVGALLASLLGLDRIFGSDHDDGSLDLLQLAPVPFAVVALAKGFAHWIVTGLPLVVATPLLGLLLGIEPRTLFAVTVSLLIGTPGLTFLGLAIAGLAVALPRGGLLIAVLIFPLATPILIFGAAAAQVSSGEFFSFGAPAQMLAAVTLLMFVAGPVVAGAAIRQVRD